MAKLAPIKCAREVYRSGRTCAGVHLWPPNLENLPSRHHRCWDSRRHGRKMARSSCSLTRLHTRASFWRLLASAWVPVVQAPSLGFPSAEEASRIASDLEMGLTYISTKGGTAWLPALPPNTLLDSPTGSSSSSGVEWKWYLLTGAEDLEPTLSAWLPPIPGRRSIPTQLKGKNFFGGKVAYAGYSKHLLPLLVCAMLPPSERRFVWWDRELLGGWRMAGSRR